MKIYSMFHSTSDRVSSGLTNRPKLLSGSNPHLANRISETLGVPLIPRKITCFKNGEICVSIQESVRNRDVFVIQSKSPTQNLNDMLMELLIIIDACRRSALVVSMLYFLVTPMLAKIKKKSPENRLLPN